MKKEELVKLIKEKFELKNKIESEEKINEAIEVLLTIGEALPEPTNNKEKYSANLGAIKVEKVFIPEKSGISPTGAEWTKEAHSKIKIVVK